MNAESARRILESLGDADRVLDIGGWMKPFPRADYVMDIMPYEGRGKLGSAHDGEERFDESTWIVRDFCDREPYPFADNELDFAICSHVLEDVRDPVFICSELQRVAKAGYVETPSRLIEQMIGVESSRYAGYCHHRWLVEAEGNRLWFTMKNPRIMSSWRHQIPRAARKGMSPADEIVAFFWSGSFECAERILITVEEIEADLARVVRNSGVYPEARYALWSSARKARNTVRKALTR